MADLRAATPSTAAELAVPDRREVRAALEADGGRLAAAVRGRLDRERRELVRLASSRAMTDPASYFKDKRLLLDYQGGRLVRAMERLTGGRRERLSALAAALDAMSPLKVLGRGYAIARKSDGRVIASVRDTAPGEEFRLRVSDGQLACQVTGQDN